MKSQLIALAKENKIDEIRFIDAEPLTDAHIGKVSLFHGRQAKELMPSAKSVIVVAAYIAKFVAPLKKGYGRVGRLALSQLGANIVEPLRPLALYLESLGYSTRIEDDMLEQAELPIKGSAVKAGLGWIGKNTLLVTETYGSFLALGAMLTDAVLHEEYTPAKNRCGTCEKCVSACPTNALRLPRQLNRLFCVSHILDGGQAGLSLENVDTQGYVLRCDICQNICPWNQKHIENPLATPYGDEFVADIAPLLSYKTLSNLTEQEYNQELAPLLGVSAVPYKAFRRNIELAGEASAYGGKHKNS